MDFLNGFPYTNFHELNLDWIIKICKDFLDQYTHIQELIANGEQSLLDKTASGLEQLQEKADTLTGLLDAWYTEHSEDIANQLADALQDIAATLATSINSFNTAAENKAAQTLETIPDDYTTMYNNMVDLLKEMPTKMSAGVKGYANPGDETLISGTIFKGSVGQTVTTQSLANSNSVKYPVQNLDKVEVVGYSWDPVGYGLYMFLDADNKILSKYPTGSTPETSDGMIVDVPHNAMYICVNGDTPGHPAEVKTAVFERSFEDSTRQFMKTYDPDFVDFGATPVSGTIYKGTVGNAPQSYSYAYGSNIKVDVEAYPKIMLQGNTFVVANNFRLCFFLDANDIIVATVDVPQGGYDDLVVDVPANAKYALVNGDTPNFARFPKAWYPVYNTDFEDRTKSFVITDVVDYIEQTVSPTTGTIYKGAVGELPSAQSYTDGANIRVPLTGQETIQITGNSFDTSRGYRVCFFLNTEGYIVQTVDATGGVYDMAVPVPYNAAYALINGDLEPNPAAPAIAFPQPVTDLSVIMSKSNPAKGKKILLLGDSITQLGTGERGWVRYFNALANASVIDNTAVIGARWTDYDDHTVYDGNPASGTNAQNVIGNQVQRIINNPTSFQTSYDYIMILAGVNDPLVTDIPDGPDFNAQYYSGNSILSLDSVDRSTWPGATRWVVEKLAGLFPSAKIIFATILNPVTGYNIGHPLNTGDMIRRCAKVCSVRVCDIEECGIRPDDTTMYVDNLHPSAKGAQVMGEYIANWFRHNM